MRLKYWGQSHQKGLVLTADLYDSEGQVIHQGFSMTETVSGASAIYSTTDILTITGTLNKGVYVTRIFDGQVIIGQDQFVWDGVKQLHLFDIALLTDKEKMQLRDALGIDGDKMVAKGGQLQTKSEAPYNTTVNTTEVQ